MKTAIKFLAAFLCTLPFAASADWNLLIAPANVTTELSAPGILELRVTNTGTDGSPAMDLQAGLLLHLLPDYQIEPLSGGCGPWREDSFARIEIPAIASGGNLVCRYRFTALRSDSQNFRLSFTPIDRPNAPGSLIHIGALTDLSATANLMNSRLEGGQTINRYQINVANTGPNAVDRYGFGSCTDPPLGYTVRRDFPGGCAAGSGLLLCFMSGFQFTAGPVQPGQLARCEIETVGVAAPNLGAIRLVDSIRRVDGRELIDTNPQNDRLSLGATNQTQVPTLSWLGLIALLFGVMLVARRTV